LTDWNVKVRLVSRTDSSGVPAVSHHAALAEYMSTRERQGNAHFIVVSYADPTLKHTRVHHLIFLPVFITLREFEKTLGTSEGGGEGNLGCSLHCD
jgi:hypothetical protein